MTLLNTIQQGDCLDIMQAIPDSYVNLIYCDILFNTGRRYHDYVDRLGTPEMAVKWYEPRIREMRRVLKSEGSIFIHCDPNLSHYIKVLMDGIFGIGNFQNEIIWHYRRWTSTAKSFLKMHDTILFYSKAKRYTFHPLWTEYTEGSKNRKKHYHTRIKGKDVFETSVNPKGVRENDVWTIPLLNSQSKERAGYDTQKPIALLERIIEASSNEGDVVADFFCGSGTTLAAAAKLGRKYIGCDINQKAVEISRKRIRNLQGR